MAYELTPEERETHLNMTGDNHGEWEVFTDDPYWIKRLEKLGIEPFQKVGWGFKYRLSADQVLIRKGKRQVGEAQRTAMRERAKNLSRTRVLAT
ncbi:MAG: hypothetical protein E6Q97_30650 [Desulfurellales bacterium]|nr:MAG: hypothetical protein E6Q97_30650 [Desulfurellales bacterium]